jgi:hypothetical protein
MQCNAEKLSSILVDFYFSLRPTVGCLAKQRPSVLYHANFEAYCKMLSEMRPGVHSCITLNLRLIVACLRISGVLAANSQPPKYQYFSLQFSSFLLIAKKASTTLVSYFSSSQNFLTPMLGVYWVPTTVLETFLGIPLH